jgi:PKD repeat protein
VADPRNGCQHDLELGPRNTVVRYTVLANEYTIDTKSEKTILETLPLPNKVHNGGDMHFGVDGMLYVTLGDGSFRAEAYSQDLSQLFGKVLRITEDGGIPASGNPYTGTDTAPCAKGTKLSNGRKCQEIFAYGFRNPFRMTMDPHSTKTVRFLINDVGGKTWEETNVGGAGYVGANYGWPRVEGPCAYASKSKCGLSKGFTDPIFWYPHNSEDNGAAVGIAITPTLTNWPSKFQNSFFVAEFNDQLIFHVHTSKDGCRNCSPPRSNYTYTTFHAYDKVVSLRFGPYETNSMALYYTTRKEPVTLRRIVFQGSGNNAPTAAYDVSKSLVKVGEKITVDASKSYDPDPNDILSYEWDFGDQSAVAKGMVATHTYAANGVYEVELTVADDEGYSHTTRTTVSVGTLPTVSITSPVAGTMFAVGQVFTLAGKGVDSKGKALGGESLYWEVQQHHGGHFHPFYSGFGTTTVLPEAPAPEDFSAAANSYLKILLTATDSIGLSATVEQDILPKQVYLDFDTVPTGLELSLDEETVKAPYRALSWENHSLHVIAPNQNSYKFSRWSNGANQNDFFKISKGNNSTNTYVATFANIKPSPSPLLVTLIPTTQQVVAEFVGNNGLPSQAFPLKLCQSDCDKDDDCENDLVCFHRSGEEDIPGCIGYNKPRFNKRDFCVLPSSRNVRTAPVPIPPSGAVPVRVTQNSPASVVGNNGLPATLYPLQRCQSDCDSDNDCAADLICFERNGNEAIPGCSGHESAQLFGLDFCVEP